MLHGHLLLYPVCLKADTRCVNLILKCINLICMGQHILKKPNDWLLGHNYSFHHLAEEDIEPFLSWMNRETADSMLNLFRLSQSSRLIQMITGMNSEGERVSLLTLFPSALTQLKTPYQMAGDEFSLANLHLNANEIKGPTAITGLMSSYLDYLTNELRIMKVLWELRREDRLYTSVAEAAGFRRVFKDDLPFRLYFYAG